MQTFQKINVPNEDKDFTCENSQLWPASTTQSSNNIGTALMFQLSCYFDGAESSRDDRKVVLRDA